jgi:hypothetical protein
MQATDHERIARLSATLPLRTDADRVRAVLADAFIEHIDALWPAGDPNATPEWIAANVDSMLATLERLFAAAAETDTLGAAEFLDRMSWLPALVDQIAVDGTGTRLVPNRRLSSGRLGSGRGSIPMPNFGDDQ